MTLCFLLDLPAVHIQQCEEAGEAQRCPVHVEQPHGEYSDTRKTSLEAADGSLRHFQELKYSQVPWQNYSRLSCFLYSDPDWSTV